MAIRAVSEGARWAVSAASHGATSLRRARPPPGRQPISALDVSIRAQVLNLLQDMQRRFGLTYLFIAHDLAVVRQLSERIAVLYLGKSVELADRDTGYRDSMHPYTKALLSTVPIPHPCIECAQECTILQGDAPSPANPPSGRPSHPPLFHGRARPV